jgi:hypothetical protein
MLRYERAESSKVLSMMMIAIPITMVVAMVPLIIEVASGQTHPGILAVLVVPFTILAMILPGISKLSIRLSDETLEVRMGVFSKKILLRDVVEIHVVSVPWYAGWGLRYGSRGELWRVNGHQALSLEMRHNEGNFSIVSTFVNEFEQQFQAALSDVQATKKLEP